MVRRKVISLARCSFFVSLVSLASANYYVSVNVSRLERTSCFTHLGGNEGYLESPDYPYNYPRGFDCSYDIARPTPQHCGVKIYAEVLRIATGTGDAEICTYDWLSMESCVPVGGARLCGDLTGRTFQYLYQPGASALRFHFHSSELVPADTPIPYRYRLRYRTLTNCAGLFQEPPKASDTACYTRITDKKGTMNTPFYPKQYPPNVDCVYEFIRPSPFTCGVRMGSVDFQLEPSFGTPFGGACSDYFQTPGCGFLCGNITFSWIARYQPGALSQRFHFHSDEVNNFMGFLIAFEQLYHC